MSQKNERRAFVVAFFLLIFLCVISQEFAPPAPPTPTPTPIPIEFQDRSFLTGEPCEAPCWYGLVPGVSSKDNVLDLLPNLNFLNGESIVEQVVGYYDLEDDTLKNGTRITADCWYPQDARCVYLTLVDDALKHIGIAINYDITFGEIAESLGPPDLVSATPEGEKFYCIIELVWLARRLSVSYYEYDFEKAYAWCTEISNGKKIDPNMKADFVHYSSRIWVFERKGYYLWPGFDE